MGLIAAEISQMRRRQPVLKQERTYPIPNQTYLPYPPPNLPTLSPIKPTYPIPHQTYLPYPPPNLPTLSPTKHTYPTPPYPINPTLHTLPYPYPTYHIL